MKKERAAPCTWAKVYGAARSFFIKFIRELFFSPSGSLYFTESFQLLNFRKGPNVFYRRLTEKIYYEKDWPEDLVRDNYADIYRYCWRYLGQKETAEDITQEVFLKFFKNIEKYREYGKLKNYLYVIARNMIRDYYRKFPGNAENFQREKEGFFSVIPENDEMERAETRFVIREALMKLEKKERDIIILRYYQELRIRDIAQILEMPASTVRYRLKQAEKKLRREFFEKEN